MQTHLILTLTLFSASAFAADATDPAVPVATAPTAQEAAAPKSAPPEPPRVHRSQITNRSQPALAVGGRAPEKGAEKKSADDTPRW